MEQGVLLFDRLPHSAALVILVAGSFMLMDLVLRRVLARAPACAGSFNDAGGFHLFDRPVDHKRLRVHQMRYFAPLWPYDLTWNAIGLVLLAIGIAIAWRADQTMNRG